MKKLLTAFALMASVLSAHAKETIQIIYAFNPADSIANYGRTLADEASKLQDKYNFVFDVKPGGGQVIAANYVKNTPNTIFMTSSAFWLRPRLYPNDSWNVYDFKPIVSMCTGAFSISSGRYKDWSQVPKDKPVSITIAGVGTITHVMALQLAKVYPNLILVPYKSTAESLVAVMSGQTDFAISFVSDAEKYSDAETKNRLHILGITGNKKIGAYSTLSSQGFSPLLAKMNTSHSLMITGSWNDSKAKEVQDILVKAEKSISVRNTYKPDYCEPLQVPVNRLGAWFNEQNDNWINISNSVKID